MEDLVDEFVCRADDGTLHTVHEYQEMTTFRPLDGPPRQLAGMKRLELADGSSYVNYRDGVIYEIVSTGELVRRVESPDGDA